MVAIADLYGGLNCDKLLLVNTAHKYGVKPIREIPFGEVV